MEYEAEANENMSTMNSTQMGENKTMTSTDAMRGAKVKRQYQYCKTPGATPLCDEKNGCEVCFDPEHVARNGLNRSQICNEACREFNAGELGNGAGAFGTCRFFSVPNTSDVHQAAPIMPNRCNMGLVTKTTMALVLEDGRGTVDTAGSWLPAMEASPVSGFAWVNVHASNFFGDESRALRIADGHLNMVPRSCWSEAGGPRCIFAVNDLYLRVTGFEVRGESLTEIEIKNDHAFELIGSPTGANLALANTSARLIARLNYNGQPRIWALRTNAGFTGEIHYDTAQSSASKLMGTFSTTLVDAGPLNTDVTLTFNLDAWFRAEDVDGDGIANHLDNCRTEFNPDQSDGDLDGVGSACDPCNGFGGRRGDGNGGTIVPGCTDRLPTL